ncbi:uncharacterized protein LOC115213450 [Argonauta hians]
MRTLFLPGKRCWTYFCLIALFNLISIYFGWTLFENLTRIGSRRHLSSRSKNDIAPQIKSFINDVENTSLKTLRFEPLRETTHRIFRNDLLSRNPNNKQRISQMSPPTNTSRRSAPSKPKGKSGKNKIHEDNLLIWKQSIFKDKPKDKKGLPKGGDKKKNKKGRTASSRSIEFFNTRMNNDDLRAFTDILSRFVELVTANNLTYFLYSGTLLGSFRHHGIIPWDDDMDVIMNATSKPYIQQILSSRSPNYILNVKQGKRWKFYSTLSRPIPGIPWAWPYLDISFFKENKTHIWDSDPFFSSSYTFHKKHVFPLSDRPFMDSMLPAPGNPEYFLKNRYSMKTCKSNIYDHKLERFISKYQQRTISCEALMGIYPFVTHQKLPGGGVNETLIFKGSAIRSFVRKK